MGKARTSLHPLGMSQVGGHRSYSPTLSTSDAQGHSPTFSMSSDKHRHFQQDSSTESSPSDEDISVRGASGGKDMRRLIEGFKCHECDKELTILTGRQCSFCGVDKSPFYCISCTEEGCMERFCMKHETCWDSHLPRSKKQSPYHKRIDPLPQLFVDVVTHSEGDRHKQKQMHQRDEQARWFNIRRDHFQGRPDLFIYDRFIQLCDPMKSGNTGTKRHYPSFVSFVGDTSVGKSTLVRSMLLMGIANPTRYIAPSDDLDPYDDSALNNLVAAMDKGSKDGPVTRSEIFDHQKYPTTCGVHLYRDEGISMGSNNNQSTTLSSSPQVLDKYPILFADCEGFNAGEAMTNAERLETDELEPHRGRDFADPRARSPSRRRDMAQQLPVTASCYNSRGKDGIDLFYARFLYAISDVIIFVTKDDTKIQMELTRVLEWASKAVHKSVNHPSRKTLIIVRNMANFHDVDYYDNEKLKSLYLSNHPKLWEESDILRDFVKDYNSKPDRPFLYRITTNERLYKALFNNIVCCYIPNKKSIKGRPQELFRQYQSLRDTIEASVREGLTLRAESVMQYNVPALTHILNRAFEHFTTSEQPFDFYLAARKDNPNPQSMTEHVANFLRHAFEAGGERKAMDGMVKDVISVALLTYTYREFSEGLGARPEEIFERELEKICSKAIEMYISQYEMCSFRFPDGQCCASRPVKLHTEHTAGKGQFEPGLFVHQRQWRSGDKRDWISETRQRFVESYEAIFINNDDPDLAATPEKRLTSRRECGHSTYSLIWKNIKSNKTCLSCLQAVPDHVLTCGHSYCPRCVQELGQISQSSECAWTMQCRLCWEAKGGNLHIVQLRPRCAGVRILTLDGGGIRGIVELAVLDALHKSVGLKLLPKDMFDLIVGTSTGMLPSAHTTRSRTLTNYRRHHRSRTSHVQRVRLHPQDDGLLHRHLAQDILNQCTKEDSDRSLHGPSHSRQRLQRRPPSQGSAGSLPPSRDSPICPSHAHGHYVVRHTRSRHVRQGHGPDSLSHNQLQPPLLQHQQWQHPPRRARGKRRQRHEDMGSRARHLGSTLLPPPLRKARHSHQIRGRRGVRQLSRPSRLLRDGETLARQRRTPRHIGVPRHRSPTPQASR